MNFGFDKLIQIIDKHTEVALNLNDVDVIDWIIDNFMISMSRYSRNGVRERYCGSGSDLRRDTSLQFRSPSPMYLW